MEDAIRALQLALELHDPGEREHAERVAVYAVATGEKLGMSDEDLIHLRRAGQLHDVGKIAVDRVILRKMGTLTEQDFEDLKKHADAAVDVLSAFPWLSPSVPMIRSHHERWDGMGYPRGLEGDEIPLGGRILAVAEAFDVMVSGSAWRRPLVPEDACMEIRDCSGTQFDPNVVAAFLSVQPLIQPLGQA